MAEDDVPRKHHHSLFRSFRYALQGLATLCRRERNFRIHLGIAIVVCSLAWWLSFSRTEWYVLLLTIGFVLAAEAVNSALETVVDLVQPEHHPLAGRAKDIAAGAVLIAAVISVMIGLLLFIPPLWKLARQYLE